MSINENEYDYVDYFNDGLAKVKKNGKWGYINKSGELVIPCVYNDADLFYDGFAGVKQDGKCGFIDKSGKQVVECKYEEVDMFKDGLAKVKKNGKWGYINRSGEQVVEGKYEDADLFYDGFAGVKQDGKWGFVNESGELVVPCVYDDVGYFFDGFALVKQNGKWGFIDESGEQVVECKYERETLGCAMDPKSWENEDYLNDDLLEIYGKVEGQRACKAIEKCESEEANNAIVDKFESKIKYIIERRAEVMKEQQKQQENLRNLARTKIKEIANRLNDKEKKGETFGE